MAKDLEQNYLNLGTLLSRTYQQIEIVEATLKRRPAQKTDPAQIISYDTLAQLRRTIRFRANVTFSQVNDYAVLLVNHNLLLRQCAIDTGVDCPATSPIPLRLQFFDSEAVFDSEIQCLVLSMQLISHHHVVSTGECARLIDMFVLEKGSLKLEEFRNRLVEALSQRKSKQVGNYELGLQHLVDALQEFLESLNSTTSSRAG